MPEEVVPVFLGNLETKVRQDRDLAFVMLEGVRVPAEGWFQWRPSLAERVPR